MSRKAPRCVLAVSLLMLELAPRLLSAQSLTEAPVEFARGILSMLSSGDTLALEFRNQSFLPAASAAEVRRAVEEELKKGGIQPAGAGAAAAEAAVTLSENAEGYVWVAEIAKGERKDTIILGVPRPPSSVDTALSPPVSISRTLLLAREEPILDAAVSGDWLVVLGMTGISVYSRVENGWQLARSMAATKTPPPSRAPRGHLVLNGDSLEARLSGVLCTASLQPGSRLECQEGKEPAQDTLAGLVGWGDDAATLETQCASRNLTLVTRASDPGEPDAIQAVEIVDRQARALSEPLEFTGPVVVLHPSPDKRAAFVVVRDLTTGRYGAFTLSVACSP